MGPDHARVRRPAVARANAAIVAVSDPVIVGRHFDAVGPETVTRDALKIESELLLARSEARKGKHTVGNVLLSAIESSIEIPGGLSARTPNGSRVDRCPGSGAGNSTTAGAVACCCRKGRWGSVL